MQCILSTPWPHDTSPERPAPSQPYGSSPKEQPQGSASSHCWEPEPQIPHPELSTHLSLSHWESWEYLQVSRTWVWGWGFFVVVCWGFFWNKDAGDKDQSGKFWPFKGTCSSAHSLAPYPRFQLVVPWATHSSQDFLVALWPVMGWAARDRSLFCHPCRKPSKLKSILFGLHHGHRMVLLPTKAWEHRLTQEYLHWWTVYLLFVWRNNTNYLGKSLQFTQEVLWGDLHSDRQTALDVQEMHKLLSWQIKSQPPKTPCSKLISLWFKEKEIQISVSPLKKISIPCLAAQ